MVVEVGMVWWYGMVQLVTYIDVIWYIWDPSPPEKKICALALLGMVWWYQVWYHTIPYGKSHTQANHDDTVQRIASGR